MATIQEEFDEALSTLSGIAEENGFGSATKYEQQARDAWNALMADRDAHRIEGERISAESIQALDEIEAKVLNIQKEFECIRTGVLLTTENAHHARIVEDDGVPYRCDEDPNIWWFGEDKTTTDNLIKARAIVLAWKK